jgi:hypothetical protein
MGYDAEADVWYVSTDGERVHTYQPRDLRFLVHWNAEVYSDMAEVKKVMDHTDDLTIDQAVDRLVADMRSKGTKIAVPSDPLHDDDFVRALTTTYTIAPTTEWLDTPVG